MRKTVTVSADAVKAPCKFCRKVFDRSQLMKQSSIVSSKKLGERVRFSCRPCNNKKMKAYYHSPQGNKVVRRHIYASWKKFPERQAARIKLNYAVSNGKVVKPEKCSNCGTGGRITGHHHDYSKPLEVVWLCPPCHSAEERTTTPTLSATV